MKNMSKLTFVICIWGKVGGKPRGQDIFFQFDRDKLSGSNIILAKYSTMRNFLVEKAKLTGILQTNTSINGKALLWRFARFHYLSEVGTMLGCLILQFLFILFSTISNSQPAFGIKICSTTNYTNPSSFLSNLNKLLPSLPQNAVRNGWFYNDTVGDAFGLAMCPNIDAADQGGCLNCLTQAAKNITLECPSSTTAALWYDGCFLRYSNQSFFSVADETLLAYASNTEVEPNVAIFKQVLSDLMHKLIDDVGSSPQLLAQGQANYTVSTNTTFMWGLVQCTRDLTPLSCQKCLTVFKDAMANYCPGIGCRLFGLTCYLQYETHPFYNSNIPASPPPSQKKKSGIAYATITITVASISVLLIMIMCASYWFRKQRRTTGSKVPFPQGTELNQLIMFDLNTLRDATNNFSTENKLGRGGFGEVFKGTLKNGDEIAVKKLSKDSLQGVEELRNEVELLMRLKHKNLVQVLGCCIDNDEKLLCYEYLPNGSLDTILFDDSARRTKLDWQTRFKVIEGICSGLVYLHDDSGSIIIHRDLKASNILLDTGMNPKISDFGLARLFPNDQTHKSTSNVAGTVGYIASECFRNYVFSAKSDVYSFGVLVLEIVTGRKCVPNLISYVWQLWISGKVLELKDSALSDTCVDQVTICIHIGLLCVQENPEHRPSMSSVKLMLNSQSDSMLPALRPGDIHLTIFSDDDTDSDSTGYILDKVNHDHLSLSK